MRFLLRLLGYHPPELSGVDEHVEAERKLAAARQTQREADRRLAALEARVELVRRRARA